MGIRADRYKAMVPQVRGPGAAQGPRARDGSAARPRAHQAQAQVHAARADDDRRHHRRPPLRRQGEDGDGLRRAAQPGSAALEKDGVDVIQFDEPAFNVFMDEVTDWGIAALERAAAGLKCTTAVHICYGYGIKANIDWKATLGGEWRQYESIFPALAKSRIQPGFASSAATPRCRSSLLGLLEGKDMLVGAIDVASDTVETPEEVAAVAAAGHEARAQGAHPALHQLRHGAHAPRHRLRQAGGAGARAPRWPASATPEAGSSELYCSAR